MSEPVERADINPRAIAWAALSLCIGVALAAAAAYFAWQHWRPATRPDGPNAPFDFSVDRPLLDSAPQPARNGYFSEKERLLHSYQWIDSRAGIARIPVEQAMQILAARAGNTSNTGAENRR